MQPADATLEAAAVWVPLERLKPWPGNPRRNDKAIDEVAAAIRRFGWSAPIVAREQDGEVIAGHTRLEAAKRLGLDRVPVRFLKLDPADAHLLAVADNRLGDIAEWDDDKLAAVLAELRAAEVDLTTGTGLSDDEIRDLLGDDDGPLTEGDEGLDHPEQLQEKWQTARGQLWEIPSQRTPGRAHRLLVGDSTDADAVVRLMNGERARWCFTDPPWNVAYGASDHPSWRSREILNDNLGDKFPAFCRSFAEQIRSSVVPGAMLYMVMSAQEWPVIDGVLREVGFHWSSTVIWAKDRLVLSRKDYHTQYEPLWFGWEGGAPRLCPLTDRTQSDLWQIDRPARSEDHPTTKPIELVARALRNSSRPGDLGVDLFAGSGSTAAAAEQLGRVCYSAELDPRYAAVVLERLSLLGLQPRLA